MDVKKENKKMKNIDVYLYKYGLHDCVVEKIFVHENALIFCFNTGVYNLNEKGTETTKTPQCLMCLEIEDLNKEQMWKHIEISKIKKNKICEIDYEEFVKEVDKSKFEIVENYLSYFGNSILLEGYTSKNKYQIKVSEITKIEFNFK